jgi:hypothetical protein
MTMRNLLAFFAAAAITFVGLGWYLDWYQVRSQPGPAGHHNVNIDFNKVKIAEDVHKGVQKGEEKLQKVLEKDATPSKDSAPTIDGPILGDSGKQPPVKSE